MDGNIKGLVSAGHEMASELKAECGAVDMRSVAKRETRLADDVRLLRQEERERRKNIEKLIQIERNAKARIRRATKSRTE
ncbi:hypothetical protein D9D42_10995 [Escherichia coli]|uniref:hypothetical protein n=1 Tax=Escherichia coli TaxID=562 RepID=UPI000FB6C6C1|nr:hypothetical protein [Escherichia coli]MHY17545.1 hypothetical protein [Escherichia coli]NKA22240.1 hypothetical protein [Escherichia coli]